MLPYEFMILDIESAAKLRDYLLSQNSKQGTYGPIPDYHKMAKQTKIFDIYKKLDEFINYHAHYINNLANLDSSDYQKRDENY